MSNNFFLTGYPGTGKSTLIRKLIRELKITPGGFITRREVTSAGEERLLLLPAEIVADWRVRRDGQKDLQEDSRGDGQGEYQERGLLLASRQNRGVSWQVDITVFNRQGVELLERGLGFREIIVLDELGRFELQAFSFQQKVFEALASDKPVLGVLKYERNQFLNQVWDSPGVEVFWVEEEQRDSVDQLLLQRLSGLIFHRE